MEWNLCPGDGSFVDVAVLEECRVEYRLIGRGEGGWRQHFKGVLFG